jgi:DNA-binding MarR family transcriptional regulator
MQGGVSPGWLEIDLTMPQLKIMFLLNAHTRMRMGELADTLGRNLSTTTGVVDKLVEHGLVDRVPDPVDRRVVVVGITERGNKLCNSLLKIGSDETKEVLERLTVEELQQVHRGMEIYFKSALSIARTKIHSGQVVTGN